MLLVWLVKFDFYPSQDSSFFKTLARRVRGLEEGDDDTDEQQTRRLMSFVSPLFSPTHLPPLRQYSPPRSVTSAYQICFYPHTSFKNFGDCKYTPTHSQAPLGLKGFF